MILSVLFSSDDDECFFRPCELQAQRITDVAIDAILDPDAFSLLLYKQTKNATVLTLLDSLFFFPLLC